MFLTFNFDHPRFIFKSILTEVKNFVDLTEKTFGKVNVMFNNAGIMHSDDDNAMATEVKRGNSSFITPRSTI